MSIKGREKNTYFPNDTTTSLTDEKGSDSILYKKVTVRLQKQFVSSSKYVTLLSPLEIPGLQIWRVS